MTSYSNSQNFKVSSTSDNPFKVSINLNTPLDLQNIEQVAYIKINSISFPQNWTNISISNNKGEKQIYDTFFCYYKKNTPEEIRMTLTIPIMANYNIKTLLDTILDMCREAFILKPETFNIESGIDSIKEGRVYFTVNKNIGAHNAYLLEFSGENNCGTLFGAVNWVQPPEPPLDSKMFGSKHYTNMPPNAMFVNSLVLLSTNLQINVFSNIKTAHILKSEFETTDRRNIIHMFNSSAISPYSNREIQLDGLELIRINDSFIQNFYIECLDSTYKNLIPVDNSALMTLNFTAYYN